MRGIEKRANVIFEICGNVENPSNELRSTGTQRITDDPSGSEFITLWRMLEEKSSQSTYTSRGSPLRFASTADLSAMASCIA
jgi:hypothetical protein